MKNELYKAIEKYGYLDVMSFTGMKSYDLFRVSKHPINCESSAEILYDLTISGLLPSTYEKFNLDWDGYDGALRWDGYAGKNYVYVLATPFLEGECNVPVDVEVGYHNEDGNYVQLIGYDSEGGEWFDSYDTPNQFNDIEELLIWYKDVYLKTTYSFILRALRERGLD